MKILTLAWLNKEALVKTHKYGYVYLFSRKRKKIWLKGSTSLNFQILKSIFTDCDSDSVVFNVFQLNNISCHKGFSSCFYKKIC
ncbi:phosphoribosyl-AMP cyclohydrolase [Candidatus Vidania fulgoroideorum]